MTLGGVHRLQMGVIAKLCMSVSFQTFNKPSRALVHSPHTLFCVQCVIQLTVAERVYSTFQHQGKSE